MKIIHRVSVSSSDSARSELFDIGIAVQASGHLMTFEIAESDEMWPRVQRWIAATQALDIVSTRFSRQEIAAAEWLLLEPTWHHGYPQPDPDNFGYLAATFDLSNYCRKCGIGRRQHAPFQMKGEPKWGKNEILQLNWIFDQYFVTPPLWRRVFEPRGIPFREVLNNKGRKLESVVQLEISEEVEVITEGLSPQKCTECGQVKFLPPTRGEFPAMTRTPTGSMARTVQYFGSGRSARQPVLISQDLNEALDGVRGASVRPVSRQPRRLSSPVIH